MVIEYNDLSTGEKIKNTFLSVILTRPELNNVLTGKAPDGSISKDVDGAIILHCVKNPNYEEKDLKFLRKEFCVPMVEKILSESGLKKPTQEELKKVLGGMDGKRK